MKYVIFGSGRVGSNMASYLRSFGHDVDLITHHTARNDPSECIEKIKKASVIAAAIPDDNLFNWHKEWKKNFTSKNVIHFSGAVNVDGLHSFHPLYSFPKTPTALKDLHHVAFACPRNGPRFEEIFPGAPNPNFKIALEDKPHYHALAVVSGNFAAHLWNETARAIQARYDVPPAKILPVYFKSIVDRFVENPTSSLTGPVARGDTKTIESNLDAIADSPKLFDLYRSFLRSALPIDYSKFQISEEEVEGLAANETPVVIAKQEWSPTESAVCLKQLPGCYVLAISSETLGRLDLFKFADKATGLIAFEHYSSLTLKTGSPFGKN